MKALCQEYRNGAGRNEQRNGENDTYRFQRRHNGQRDHAQQPIMQPSSLFRILCKCLFSEVTVRAVTELDNKAAHCHSPVLQRHRPFLGRRLDCQPHHFFTESSVGNTLRFLIAWRITLFSDSMAFVV